MPAIADAVTSAAAGFLPIDGDVAKKVMDKYPSFTQAGIPANSYQGFTADVPTLSVRAFLVAREDLDANLVYWLTRILIERQPELAQADPRGKDLSKESTVKDVALPFHPGAELYYREVGVLK